MAVALCDANGANLSTADVTVTALSLVRVSDQVTAPVEAAGDSSRTPGSGGRTAWGRAAATSTT